MHVFLRLTLTAIDFPPLAAVGTLATCFLRGPSLSWSYICKFLFQFIMQKRKEKSEEKANEEPENAGELRSIVADAKAVAAQEEIEFRRRTSSTGKKPAQLAAPAPAPRPKSFAGPETKPRKDSKAERKSSRGTSFDSEFIPPPPVLDYEDQPRSGEGSPRVSIGV